MKGDGNSSANEAGNGSTSSGLILPTGERINSVPLVVGSFSIDDAIAMHLVDCDQCRRAIETLRPVGMGQKSGHCDAYWQLQLMRASYEGARNNIVAHTEYGDEAPKGGPLE